MYRSDWQERLNTARVGIAGAGGLGSNCAAALVRAGVGSLVIADFDVVSETNLNRQFYFKDQVGISKVEALKINLQQIDPGVNVDIHEVRVDQYNAERIFIDCDIFVEAMDQAEEKASFIEIMLTSFPGRPLVAASGMAGWGAFADIKINRHQNLYICGDLKREIGPEMPPIAPRVGIVAHMQANAVMELIINGKVT